MARLAFLGMLILLFFVSCQKELPKESNYNLSVEVLGRGSVSPSYGQFHLDSIITFYLEPSKGWAFSHWEGQNSFELHQDQGSWRIRMNGHKNLLAIFKEIEEEKKSYQLVVNSLGQGEVSPKSGSYLENTLVQLTVMPENGWLFKEWLGRNSPDVIEAGGSYSLLMDSNKELMALFTQRQYNLLVEIQGEGFVQEKLVSEEYPANSLLRLWAQPTPGWYFQGWQGDASGNEAILYLELNQDKYLKAIFAKENKNYSLTIRINGQGRVEKNLLASDEYPAASLVELVAKGENGWLFKGWSGDHRGSSPRAIIEMDSDKEIIASFYEEEDESEEYYILEVDIQGQGSVKKSPDERKYLAGTLVNLSASPQAAWEFQEWQGDLRGAASKVKLTMDEHKYVLAIFREIKEKRFRLNLDIIGEGQVIKTPDSNDYLEGEVLVLEARASVGWEFQEWQGDLSGRQAQMTLLMDRDKQIKAVFEKQQLTYPLNLACEGSGTVTKDPDMLEYPEGTLVTLIASPASGWTFKSWSGDASGSASAIQVKMDGPKRITAIFAQQSGRYYRLTVTGEDNKGVVKKEPDQNDFVEYSKVKLTAFGNPGYCIYCWEVNGKIFGANPLTLIMNEDKRVKVSFMVNP